MLPIVDKPVIHYVVEELVEAGIEQIVIVTGWHKRAIEDYFDRHLELEAKLEEAKKIEQLESIKKISEMAEFVYVRQKEMNGNGGAILCAKNVIGDEPFIVHWADDFFVANPSSVKQTITAYNKYGGMILAGFRTKEEEDTFKYGYAVGKEVSPGILEVDKFVEKPGPGKFASEGIAIVSAFVFNPDIFFALERVKKPKGQELVYVDGVNALMKQGEKAYAVEIKNSRFFDTGNVLSYLKTNVEFALKRKDIGKDFKKYLAGVAKENGIK